jgi:hypothetical protein
VAKKGKYEIPMSRKSTPTENDYFKNNNRFYINNIQNINT